MRALDDAYAAPFKVLWHSLMATDSIPWGTPIFLLHGGDRLSAGVRRDLASYIGGYGRSVQFIDAHHLLPRDLLIQWHNHVTEAAFIRLFLGSALPTTITSAVYLDVDAVALHSLRELFELPLTAPIAAADHLAPAVALRLWGDRGGQYFQSGVLVIDLAWWRQTHVEAQYRRIIAERGDALLLHHQDVLNIAFADSWQPIPVWFNACRFVRQHLPPAELPTVVRYLHFDGHEKPWNHPSNRWEHRVWYQAYQEAFGQPFDRRPFRRQALGLAIRHLTRTARFAIGRLRVPELW